MPCEDKRIGAGGDDDGGYRYADLLGAGDINHQNQIIPERICRLLITDGSLMTDYSSRSSTLQSALKWGMCWRRHHVPRRSCCTKPTTSACVSASGRPYRNSAARLGPIESRSPKSSRKY